MSRSATSTSTPTSDAFSPLEKLVLEYAEAHDENAGRRARMSSSRACGSTSTTAALVDLTAGIAIENFRARFNYALDILPGGVLRGEVMPDAGGGRGGAVRERRRSDGADDRVVAAGLVRR